MSLDGLPIRCSEDLAHEVVDFLRELDEFPKPVGVAWWESPEHQALMQRKAELIARIQAEQPS